MKFYNPEGCMFSIHVLNRRSMWQFRASGHNLLLPSATVVAERLCFHKCLSVHRVRCTPLPWQAHPLARHTTPPPPSRWLLQRTVRILLECFLVLIKHSISTKSCMRVYCLPPDNVRNNRSIQSCCTFELKKILIVIGYCT